MPKTDPCLITTLTSLLDAGEVLEHVILVRTFAAPAINVHKLALPPIYESLLPYNTHLPP